MVTRKTPENNEETPNKRQRVGASDESVHVSSMDTVVSFNSLNNDCIVHILSYLSNEDMNSVAECSRDCREARSNESLNQTRIGTIVWTERTTPLSFCQKLSESRRIFIGNRTHLRVKGLETSSTHVTGPEDNGVIERICAEVQLDQVTTLDCSSETHTGEQQVEFFFILTYMFPHLKDLDMSNVETPSSNAILEIFSTEYSELTTFKWNGFSSGLIQAGWEFREASNLNVISMTDAVFVKNIASDNLSLLSSEDPNCYLFMHCIRLERLTLKDATVRVLVPSETHQPVSQEMLVKMVRRHPTLRWLRSDLTAVLKKERPEITFVSE